MKKIIYLLIAILGICGSVAAQQYMSVPYSLDFELADSVEIQNWVFNPGADATFPEHWVVGSSEHSSGRCALYISADSVSAGYTVARTVQYAYRDVMLPAGKYIFSFDWKCVGSAKSTLSAGYALASQLTAMQAQKTSATIPTAIVNKVNAQMKNRNGERTWQSASFQIQSNGTDPTRVFFAWSNAETDPAACGVGACIDNIQIASTVCPRPENVLLTDDKFGNVQMTWTGASADYEVAYRLIGTDVWNVCTNVSSQGNNGTALISDLDERYYDFRVRGICSPDVSAWVNYANYFVYREDLHCINFTDLNGPNVVCTSGTTNYSGGYTGSKNEAYSTIGVIDFGWEDMRSRHTVNTNPTATDPRTNNRLPLIPSGSRASIRLGNWDTGNQAEAIIYTYTVDNTNAIVLLQYAVVLEDPSHAENEQPQFVFEVLDERGGLLDNVCGMRKFGPQMDWEVIGSGYGGLAFKPWTTLGLNVSELGVQDGEQVSIRLTTYDCFSGGHYGYAYFTLDCAKAAIDVVPYPVDEDSTSVELIAPAGFEYQWFDSQHAPIAGATSAHYVPTYLGTHYCRLTSMDNSICYFELETQCSLEDPTPDEPQNVVETHHDSMATKVLLDGRVYIERYGVLYDMMGHPVY